MLPGMEEFLGPLYGILCRGHRRKILSGFGASRSSGAVFSVVVWLEQDGKTALCHLPETAECQRLRDLLKKHGSHQRLLKVLQEGGARTCRHGRAVMERSTLSVCIFVWKSTGGQHVCHRTCVYWLQQNGATK